MQDQGRPKPLNSSGQAIRARISVRNRKRRTRCLILIGSYMEHVTQTDPDLKTRLMKGLDSFLERDRDRELFGLVPKEVSKMKGMYLSRRSYRQMFGLVLLIPVVMYTALL